MTNFIGIDLGTTNSAIASYDGDVTRIWKSPEQNDVTPSVLYFDNRGNRYVGSRAYDSEPSNPDNAAKDFKRMIGTNTPITLKGVDKIMTPEECSAEVLRTLFSYLPEEVRMADGIGTVITVPAAFSQMQKDATKQAAELAGIGAVGLMQEPVAAVMSVMRARESDGTFVIYDLGGGTLDVAIAESIGGRVSLLSHGGIAMCGGRDFDRNLLERVALPWLHDNFDLSIDLDSNPTYRPLVRMAERAAERAKIELSSRDESIISLTETEARCVDNAGVEIYLDISLSRTILDDLIKDEVIRSIEAVNDALSEAGLSSQDVECMTFVGGPTNYKPLRDYVCQAIGIPGSAGVNPMTAVAEGAAVFAESIDWSSENRSRKSARGSISSGGELDVTLNYIARTPERTAKIGLKVDGSVASGAEFQIDSLDTGWTSGRVPLTSGSTLSLTLSKNGENVFKVFIFDDKGQPVSLPNDRVVITRTAATVDAIPASYSVGVEVLEKINGVSVLDWLVKAGDALPKKGRKIFRAATSLKAGSNSSLNLKVWEGSIEDPVTDNRFVGILKITGHDFSDGIISAGDELICEYEALDSGNIVVEISVPSIGGVFSSGHNFYSRQEGGIDFTNASAMVREESAETATRLEEIDAVVDDPNLSRAQEMLDSSASLDEGETDPEVTKKAMDEVLEAKRLLASIRKDNLQAIRELDLQKTIEFFENVREFARPNEISAFDSLVKTARRSIERGSSDFETQLGQLRSKSFEILWRQDWFVAERFKWLVSSPHLFTDNTRFAELKATGLQLLGSDDFDGLRQACAELTAIQIDSGGGVEMFDVANIVRG